MKLRRPGLTRRALSARRVRRTSGRSPAASACCPRSHPGPRFPGSPTAGRRRRARRRQSTVPTPVASHLTISEDPRAGAVERIRAALAEARAARRPFIASAARHSMGGQSLARDGTVATLDQRWLEADTARKIYRVAAGTRWSTVIAKPRRARLLAGGHAVQQRLRRGQHVLGERARLAGALQRLRQHGQGADHGPGGRHGRHLLAHRERRSVPSRHGRLRAVRRDHRARARHAAERPARAALTKR